MIWNDWKDRAKYTAPGVYLIKISNTDISGTEAGIADADYIGMTCEGIAKRLYNFNRSVTGGYGHSGGNTIRKELGVMQSWPDKAIYFAALPIEEEDKIYRDALIKFKEREMILEFVKASGQYPKFNRD